MKNFILTLLFLMLAQPVIAENGTEPAEFQNINSKEAYGLYSAMESDALRISMDDTLSGFIEGKVCDACEKIRVNITPKTKAFKNGIEVPLQRAGDRIGRYATVIFETKTAQITEIRW